VKKKKGGTGRGTWEEQLTQGNEAKKTATGRRKRKQGSREEKLNTGPHGGHYDTENITPGTTRSWYCIGKGSKKKTHLLPTLQMRRRKKGARYKKLTANSAELKEVRGTSCEGKDEKFASNP